jgi:hypothetical protein
MLRHPLALEVVFGTRITIQMAGAPEDLALAQRQLLTHFPYAEVFPAPDGLPPSTAIQVFCLRESHFFPGDPLGPGRPFFTDLLHALKSAQAKAGMPLFAASLRFGASCTDDLRHLACYLRHFENADNGFIPLPRWYPVQAIAERSAYTSGVILNAAEVGALLPFPADVTRCRPLIQAQKTAPPPALAASAGPVHLGINQHRGMKTRVSIPEQWVTRHIATFGGTGVGKTTLLAQIFSLIRHG